MKNNHIILLIIVCLSFISSSNKLPKVLIIGDSISGGYFPFVEKQLEGKAILVQAVSVDDKGEYTGSEGTTKGVKEIDKWLGQAKWDVIHFNFGLHDIKHIDPETGKNSKNLNHPQQANPEQYRKNLSVIVKKLKATNAKLIFATTTPYPDKLGKQMRTPGMPKIYNQVAQEIMKKNGIEVNDLYSFVLPRLEELQRPNNVHFTEFGYKIIAGQVAQSITNQIEK